MNTMWRRIASLMVAGGVLLSALPLSAGAAPALTVTGGGTLALGAERVLELDLENESLSGRRMVTLTGYMDAIPGGYVDEGLVLRLDGLEGVGETAGLWTDLSPNGGTVNVGDSLFENGAVVLEKAVRLPRRVAETLEDGNYTIEYFVDGEGYEGLSPAPLLVSGGWSLQTKEGKQGTAMTLTPGKETKTAEVPLTQAAGAPCAIVAQYAGRERRGVWYRGGAALCAFTPTAAPGGSAMTLGDGASHPRIYSLRVYDRALSELEIRANAALDRSRFLGESQPEVPALTVGGQALDPSGVTRLTVEFERGRAELPVVSGELGEQALVIEVGDRTAQVELETVSALDTALELCPTRLDVEIYSGVSAIEVRTAVAKEVETAISHSGFTQSGGQARVLGSEQKGFRVQFTGEGRTETVPLKVTLARRDPPAVETLDRLLLKVQRGFFQFSRAEEITPVSIAEQTGRLLGDDSVEVSARWDEDAFCWMLRLERGEESAETPLYLNSRVDLQFSGPELLDACVVRAVGSDDAYVAGGTLNVSGTVGNTYEAVVLPLWNFDRDFCIEAEVRMTGAVSDSRWCGVAFGVRPGTAERHLSFWQLGLRWDASATNGVECTQMLPGGSWNPRRAASLGGRVDPERTYRLTILYQNGVVCQYVDGELLLRADVPDASQMNGKVAFTFDGSTAELLSLRLTDQLPDLPTEQAMAPNGYDAKLYEPRTGLVMSPTVVAEQGAGAAVTAAAERRPATLVRTLRPDLTVLDGGESVTVAEYLRRLDRRVLAGLRIEDLETARAFAQYAADSGIVDVNLFSTSGAVLQAACAGRAGVRGVLDCSGSMPEDPIETAYAANRAGARVVVLPVQAATRETVKYLQARAVAVWVRTDTGQLYHAILSGADGLVVADYAAALDAIESFPSGERVLTRSTIITAHRGLHQSAPENTVRAAELAIAAGAEAIECDVHLSADGVVMVSHDSTTNGLMSRGLSIAQSTRAELQGLSFQWNAQKGDRMPTLAELLQAAEGTDTVFLVEIKSLDPALIPPLVRTIRESGMVDRVVFLSYEEVQLQRVRARLPEVAVGLLDTCTQSGLDTATNLKAMAERLDPLNAFYSCPQEVQSPELTRAARHRGMLVHPWTVDEYELFEQKYYDGYHGFTTDRADFATYYLTGAEAEKTRVSTSAGEEGAVALWVRKQFRDGGVSAQAVDFVQTAGNAEVRLDGEGRFWSETPGTVEVVLGVSFTLPATQVPYQMYTLPVTLIFTAP